MGGNIIFIKAKYRTKGTEKWYTYLTSVVDTETLEYVEKRVNRENPHLEFKDFEIDNEANDNDKIAEISEVLPNGNVLINIDGHFTIEVMDFHRIYTAEILAKIIIDAINKLSDK